MVRLSCDMETNIVSVERVKEYSETETEVSGVSWVYSAAFTRGSHLYYRDTCCGGYINVASLPMTVSLVHRRQPATQQLAGRRQGCL